MEIDRRTLISSGLAAMVCPVPALANNGTPAHGAQILIVREQRPMQLHHLNIAGRAGPFWLPIGTYRFKVMAWTGRRGMEHYVFRPGQALRLQIASLLGVATAQPQMVDVLEPNTRQPLELTLTAAPGTDAFNARFQIVISGTRI